MLLFLSNIYFFLSLAIYLAVNMYVVGQNKIPLSKEIENQTRLNHFNLNFILIYNIYKSNMVDKPLGKHRHQTGLV